MYTYDSWVVMAAMAMETERIRIGAMLTPPARRRPWKRARETMTLDHLSGGRLILPGGPGHPLRRRLLEGRGADGPQGSGATLGPGPGDPDGLWSEEPFAYEGEHYRIEEMTFCPGRCRDRASQSGWSARGRAGGP